MTTLDKKYLKFRGGPARATRAPRVTINEMGLIYMNACAFDRLGKPDHVTLYYSPEDNSIAVEPEYPPTEETFPVNKKVSGHVIHASTLCRHFGLQLTGTRSFLYPSVNNGILILNLAETTAVSTRKPRRNAPRE